MAAKPYDLIKRIGDASVALVALVLSSPLQLIVAVIVAAKLGRPVLFKQPRPGRGGNIFTLYKFRTMRTAAPEEGVGSDADRLTGFGRALRATSLDELPTLFNVLRGDMSIVGPRPLLVSYLPRYSPEQTRRHEVRPGVTGLAQVSGRNTLNWADRFALDVYYVDHRSLKLDIAILGKTISTVVRREGISAEGAATMHEFFGNESSREDQ